MTPRANLRPEDRALVERILAFHVPDREVVAFGSRASGTAKPTSDLDLCVMGDKPLAPLVRQQLIDAFSASPLPYKVDVIEWAELTPRFRVVVAAAAIPLRRPPHSTTPASRSRARSPQP